jgi:hypothetical protein
MWMRLAGEQPLRQLLLVLLQDCSAHAAATSSQRVQQVSVMTGRVMWMRMAGEQPLRQLLLVLLQDCSPHAAATSSQGVEQV